MPIKKDKAVSQIRIELLFGGFGEGVSRSDFHVFSFVLNTFFSPFHGALTTFSIALNPFSIVTLVTSTFASTFIVLSDVILVELFFKSCPQFEQNFAPELIFTPH